jgi:hypothetical protein
MKKSVSLLKSTVIIEDKDKFKKFLFMHDNDIKEQKAKIDKYSEYFGFTSLIQLILFIEPSVNRRLRGKSGWYYSDRKYESWKDPQYMPDLCDGYNEPSDKELNKLISHCERLKVIITLINLIK